MNLIRTSGIVTWVCLVAVCGIRLSAADEQHSPQDRATSNLESKIDRALDPLSSEDRKLAEAQRFCAVWVHIRLGSLGTPIKIETSDKPFFVCAPACVEPAQQGGAKPRRIANILKKATARMSEFSPADRAAAEAQKFCPNDNMLLGSMGAPIKLKLDGTTIFVCCPDCIEDAKADPDATVNKANELVQAGVAFRRRQGLDRLTSPGIEE